MPLYPPDIFRELADLKRRLAVVEVAARTAPARTMIAAENLDVYGQLNVRDVVGGAGGIRVKDAADATRTYIGQVYESGSPVGHGLLVTRPGGDNVVEVYADPGGGGTFRIKDDAGVIVFNADEASGTGIGRPYLRAYPSPARPVDWPASVSATFETVMDTWATPWQPKVRVFGYLFAPAATTGEARVVCNGTQIGEDVSVTAGYALIDITAAIPALTAPLLDDLLQLAQLQIRCTAGVGPVNGMLVSVETVQS